MREIKFNYIWERPKCYYGPYYPSDVKYKHTYLTLSEIEEGKCKPPDSKYICVVAKRQYTGLKDSRGQEIYEGDLIINESGRICKVVWFQPTGQWDVLPIGSTIDTNAEGFKVNRWSTCVEIIGNIYENSVGIRINRK